MTHWFSVHNVIPEKSSFLLEWKISSFQFLLEFALESADVMITASYVLITSAFPHKGKD